MTTDQPGRIDVYLSRQARLHGDMAALRQDERATVSFARLDVWVSSVADHLRARGLRPGDRLMIVTENGIEVVVAIMAALRAGAIATPVNARMTAGEIARIAADATPRLTVFCTHGAESARMHADLAGAEAVDWAGSGSMAIGVPCDARPEPMPDNADRPAVLLYTNGTTGPAKGVLLSQSNLIYGGGSSARLRGMRAGDLILGVLPLTHVFGLTSMLCAAMMTGAEIWLWPRFCASQVLDALHHGVTMFPCVPQMHALVMAEAEARGETHLRSESLRYVSSGGAALDPVWKRKAERFYQSPVQNGYGMTETTAGAALTCNLVGAPDISVGPPLPGCEIRIAGGGRDPGVGEVEIRGPNIMLGYFRDPQATRVAMTDDGFIRSGDLGRFDAQGRLHIVGRLKELIIRSGFNVYPSEVEAALNGHADVVQSAVVGRPCTGNEEVIAFCQMRRGARLDEVTLIAHAARRLTRYKVPSRIVLCDAIPASPTGKILKHRLLDHFAAQLGQKRVR